MLQKFFVGYVDRVIDGDTLEVSINTGFGIQLKNQRLRLMNVDCPESRTSDEEEKVYGLKAKEFTEKWCELNTDLDDNRRAILQIEFNEDGEYMKDSFGRMLGNVFDCNKQSLLFSAPTLLIIKSSLVEEIISHHHGVRYVGQPKSNIQEKHIRNRSLISEI
jgi:hypothetical protein